MSITGSLKTASELLLEAEDLIQKLAADNEELLRQVKARDLAVKLASQGVISTEELPAKVREFSGWDITRLEAEMKLAESNHKLAEDSNSSATTTVMDFLS
jgi:hypothetical protein